jgi:hypothetical protein
VNHYEKAYRDYCEFAGTEEIDYFTMCSWAAKFNVQCVIMMYPEGFCYEVEYEDGRISGPPHDNILDAIEGVAEALFAIIETALEPHDIFDDLSGLRDAAEIHLEEGESPEVLIEPMLKEGMDSWSRMLSFNPGSQQFKDNFLEACIYISSLISIMENYGQKKQKEDGSSGQEEA